MPTDEKLNVLEDFSGGLSTTPAPNRLNPNQSPTHQNVWFYNGALAKRLGESQVIATKVFNQNWFGTTLHTAVLSGTENLLIFAGIGGNTRNIVLYTSNAATISTMSTVNAVGTVTTAVASAIVTGSGTNWLTTAKPNMILGVIGTNLGVISTVDSDTQVTMTANFGSAGTGLSYQLCAAWGLGKIVSFVDMNKFTYISGQGFSTVSWNGTVQAFVSAFPQAAFTVSWKNYIFASGTTANPARVAWSAVKDATTWPASNFVDLTPDDGFPIVGMFLDGQSLVILKTNSAWKISGDTFDPANITYTVSPIWVPNDFIINSAGSVQFWNGSFLMLGLKGMYSYDGAGVISKVSEYDKDKGEWALTASLTWAALPAPSAAPKAIIVDGNYWLTVPQSSAADKAFTYVFDSTGAVWRWSYSTNKSVSDMAYLGGTLYGVDSNAGGTPGLKQINTGNSDSISIAINGTFTTKVIQFKNTQRFGLAYLYYKKQTAGNITFEYSIDEGAFTSVTVDQTAGTGTRVKSNPIMIGQVGNSIQFRVSNNTAAQTFEIYGIEVELKENVR